MPLRVKRPVSHGVFDALSSFNAFGFGVGHESRPKEALSAANAREQRLGLEGAPPAESAFSPQWSNERAQVDPYRTPWDARMTRGVTRSR